MNPVLYIVIDIVLFLITLFIIIFYRQLDRKDRQIHLVKALMENMQYELDEKFHKMRTTVEAMEDSIQEHEIGVESLLKRIDNSLGDLDKHAEDLHKLQSYMSHYHRILNELEELTVKAEKRLQKLEPEIAELESAGVKVDAWIGEAEQIRELLAAARKEIAQYTDEESRRQTEELRRRTEIIGTELTEKITADMHTRADALLAEVTAAMN